jgi:hypothetical protein
MKGGAMSEKRTYRKALPGRAELRRPVLSTSVFVMNTQMPGDDQQREIGCQGIRSAS